MTITLPKDPLEPMSDSDKIFYASGATTIAASQFHHISITTTYFLWFSISEWLTILSFLMMFVFFIFVKLPQITKMYKAQRFVSKNKAKYDRGYARDIREQND